MASFGETLKRERELREISLRQISEATKINIRYLEALGENRSGPSRAEPDPVHASAAGPARSVQGTVDGDEGHERRPAVTGIEVADGQAPASSRVLFWVLSLVAVAGILFLILSLVRGTVPSPRRLSDLPPAHGETAPALPQGEGIVPPGGADQEAAGGAPAVLPEVSSQSPLSMGAVT